MICHACHRLSPGAICRLCRLELVPAPDRLVHPSMRLISAFEHSGPARNLMHRLKYGGLLPVAEVLAAILAPRVAHLPLVPIPRALSRRLKYGVDPAAELADRIGRLTGQPVLRVLEPRWHSPRRAGGDHRQVVAAFRSCQPIGFGVALVDDVVTTGATLVAASQGIGAENVRLAVSGTAANQVSSLLPRQPMYS